ncbi:SCO2583/SCO2584 N-terminal domain-containing protein [Streptomyces sp. NBC_00557]|uniref:SCO2583/SCO2584 N-terminal domain-containing protein n=1 Tax=Streptomyces sp. NBC_00557 TaxID=2975776 RepID=UPI002E82150D|nr:hypothetical protein [Streptomyces sp. NBC_00557]WUC37503.1 hypothetical protein OG956_26435 [Streptomyces sp. NBC_00557]
MTEQDDWEREFDHRWANSAEHKEPSARARMLAARWKDTPPDPAPFRADPAPAPRRASWASTGVVVGAVLAVMVLIGLLQFGVSR